MSGNKFKPVDEWFKQAEYDLETASAMFKTGRYIYTVFICHSKEPFEWLKQKNNSQRIG